MFALLSILNAVRSVASVCKLFHSLPTIRLTSVALLDALMVE